MNQDHFIDFSLEQRIEAEQQRIINDYYNSLTLEQQKIIDRQTQAALNSMFGLKPEEAYFEEQKNVLQGPSEMLQL